MTGPSDKLHDDQLVIDGLYPPDVTDETVTRLREGGVDVVHKTLVFRGGDFLDAVEAIKDLQAVLAATDGISQVRTVEDLQADDVGVVFGFQDTSPLEWDRDPRNASVFAQLGVRVMQLTYNVRNFSGNGYKERVDDGVSEFGHEVVEALEEYGIVLDLSHAGPRTARDAIEASSNPVVFSHSNAAGLVDHPRNVGDDLVEAAADTGGVVGITVFPPFVGTGRVTLSDFVDHVDYVADLVGTDHVAIGLDFVEPFPESLLGEPHYPDEPVPLPPALRDASDVPNVTAELHERGYSDDEIRAIMGGNLRRVFEQVW
jgi:membrane dipeptidase